ncbi:MAG: sulfotransferase [Alphaproteobacteria bacterium]|nr:sulfotransferase [Alphaproteobacteria bacterium]
MPVADGPDFICIGMQKAGTGWLFDQLQFHPDFWMTPVKQLHYLEHEKTRPGKAEKFLALARKPERLQQRISGRKRWDDRDIAFLEQLAGYRGEEMTVDRYISLFQYKQNSLSGEINSGYSGLGADTIQQVAERLPALRVFIILRDPVARAWSQISMAHRNEKFDPGLLEKPEDFRTYLETSPAIKKVAYPAQIVDRWKRSAPKLAFRWFFFDDIVKDPAIVRNEIIGYLGADPDKSSGEISADHNRKASDKKLESTETARATLIEHFRTELRACAAMFGGPADAWAAQYGA